MLQHPVAEGYPILAACMPFLLCSISTCIMSDSSSPVPATVSNEPLVISEVDADVVQPEKLGKMHVQTQLQTILATYCVEHKERAYVQPNQFRVWMQRVFPAENQPKSKNTVFYSVLPKDLNWNSKPRVRRSPIWPPPSRKLRLALHIGIGKLSPSQLKVWFSIDQKPSNTMPFSVY